MFNLDKLRTKIKEDVKGYVLNNGSEMALKKSRNNKKA